MRSRIFAAILLFAMGASVQAQEERTIIVRVLAAGRPVAGAKVWVHARGDEEADSGPIITDAAGKATAKMPAPGPQFANAFARDAQGRNLRIGDKDKTVSRTILLRKRGNGLAYAVRGYPIPHLRDRSSCSHSIRRSADLRWSKVFGIFAVGECCQRDDAQVDSDGGD
jgi:hypothetical protein